MSPNTRSPDLVSLHLAHAVTAATPAPMKTIVGVLSTESHHNASESLPTGSALNEDQVMRELCREQVQQSLRVYISVFKYYESNFRISNLFFHQLIDVDISVQVSN